jgi:hypothetical protein
MKKCLLLLAVVGVMLVSAPAYSQYLFLDVNGDGKSSENQGNPFHAGASPDLLGPASTGVDVWFVTNEMEDGSTATCSSGPELFDINSYEMILRSSGTGTVTFGAWHDNTGYTNGGVLCGDGTVCSGGTDIWIARFKTTYDPAGKYKVGRLDLTITGNPKLDFATSTSLSGIAGTSFGSRCQGSNFDNTIRLGSDFPTADGTASPIPVTPTTWGKIKNLYH